MNTLTPYIERHLHERRQRGEISEQTAIDRRYHLARLASSFGKRPITQWGPKAVDRWLGTIGHMAPATRRLHLGTVRGFARWLHAEGHATSDATAHVKPIRQPRRTVLTLAEVEVGLLLDACPDARARAIVWLMVGCGCRRIEVVRLNLEDYAPGPDATLRLIGKGGHERVVPVTAPVAAALDAWLEVRGRIAGPLVCTRNGSPMAPHSITVAIGRWMDAAGVKVRAYDGRSAHGLRRTAASDVMERSGDLRVVQAMLGHASIQTTAEHYLRPVSMMAMRDAMEGRVYRTPEVEAA